MDLALFRKNVGVVCMTFAKLLHYSSVTQSITDKDYSIRVSLTFMAIRKATEGYGKQRKATWASVTLWAIREAMGGHAKRRGETGSNAGVSNFEGIQRAIRKATEGHGKQREATRLSVTLKRSWN